MEMSRDRFKKMFPNLYEEMETDEPVTITPAESESQTEKNAPPNKFGGYSPDVVDFIRIETTTDILYRHPLLFGLSEAG